MTKNTNNTNNSAGVGFTGLLTLLFIALKLTGYVTWSWWWVLSPLWISFLLAAGLLIGVLAITAFTTTKKRKNKND
jgi:predicted tellurium resistance membrane protein TerC